MISRRELQLGTTITRWLLAIGFIPPGLTKVLGHRFTLIGPEDPIGYFFDAFFQSGAYYGFVGLAQVVAGCLLLWRRTALLGALLYLPIIANIFVITVSLHFKGTWVVTGLMLAATLYLLFWDWDRLRLLVMGSSEDLQNTSSAASTLPGEAPGRGRAFMSVASGGLALGLMGLMLGTRSLLPAGLTLPALALTAVSFPFAVGAWLAFIVRR